VHDRSEIHLIEAAAGGDIDSFGELCRRYYAVMVAIAYAVLGDHQLAEDAAQESFARALVRIKSLNDRAKFVPWLASICRNVAKDMVATNARQISSYYLSQTAKDDNHDESTQLVRQAIEQLSASDKELIVLRYYNGLSYKEIGCVLRITRPTINGRLTRTKRKMAKYLKHNGFPESRL
jgi:RNA polymerase sigma-70 factor (ECF subfamily)